ncbi:MAG: FtsX-like permease family protein [Ferruginibacter sp.]|nr:FtsX-like permease family protein [Ferruginibacter sp.]
MFKNYLKTAIRNLWRYKGFSVINIAGLAIGIAGCLLIGLFVWDELQYDKFVKGGENVYRIYNTRTDKVSTSNVASVQPAYATYLKLNYPEVESTMRIMMLSGKKLWETGETKAYEEKGLLTEGSFFDIFPFKLIKGDYKGVLDKPDAVILTAAMAEKYFGKQDPVGKIVKIDKANFSVAGVMENVPAHFHLAFDYLMSFSTLHLKKERMESWGWQQFYSYFKLKPGTSSERLQAKFRDAVKQTEEQSKESGMATIPSFQPLKDIHLKSADFEYDNARRGNQGYVKALVIIALFVLVIACFNFVNLATARSFRRAKEIGVRKVAGADRRQLILQFTGETILLSFASIIIAAVATLFILPALNNFTGKAISFNPVANPVLALILIAGAFVIGVLAGIYPAFVLSGFQPVKVLKGMKSTGEAGSHRSWLRQGLVIVQFVFSVLLIVSATIVYRQSNYLHNKDLGFNKDQVLLFPIEGKVATSTELFKNELKQNPNIVSATGGYGLPGDAFAGDEIIVPGKEGDKSVPVNLFIVDPDYITTLGLKLISGRDFSRDIATDSSEAFVINETGVKELGFKTPQEAIGQKLNWNKWEPDSANPVKKGKVIGVVKDFHYKGLHEKVSISVLQMYSPVYYKMAVKMKTADVKNTLAFINATWTKFVPDFPLDYKFMDESFDEMYKAEDKLSTLLWIFTLMAIFVGCLGLFGLAAFSAEQRNKEIGIRKVLGASIGRIVTMLSINFLKPVLIASMIAFPIAWFAMNKWLQDFPYRVSISWWVFALAAAAALVIALLTVSFQAIKAALSNPVKSLRTE